MLRRRSRKIKQKTTWKTDERKTENKKRPKNTKHEVFPTESVLKKWRVQKRRLKRGRTNYHFCNFSWEEKTRKKENIQRNISLFKRTNKQEKQFFANKKRDRANGNNSKNMASCEQGEYVKGEKTKGEKNDDQTEQSPQKRRYIKGVTEDKTIKNENLKRRMFKNTWE